MAKRKSSLEGMEELNELVTSFNTTEGKELITIPTGAFSLDVSMGTGGIPLGRFTEIYGAESTGKTTLALSICKNALDKGYRVLYDDPEQGLDKSIVKSLLGEDRMSKLTLAQPDTMEKALKIAELAIRTKEYELIVLDSIGSMAPLKVKEDELDDANVALLSRMLTTFVQRNAFDVRYNNIAFVGLNQVRDKIGSYYAAFETPGGHAWKHLTSIRIQLSKIGDIQSEDEKIGILTKFVIKKNKLANPYKTFSFPIIFGKGVDSLRDLVEFSTVIGILDKGGSYYKFEGETLSNGLTNTVKYLEEHKDTLDKIVDKCYNNMNLGRSNLYERENDE